MSPRIKTFLFLLSILVMSVTVSAGTLRIRPIEAGDVKEAAALVSRVFSSPEDTRRQKEIKKDLEAAADPDGSGAVATTYYAGVLKYFVARDDSNRLMGVVGVIGDKSDIKKALWVTSLAVAPESRGLGVGRLLMAQAIEFTRSQNKKYLRLLTTLPDHELAQSLYESLGLEIRESTMQEDGRTVLYRQVRVL